MSVERDSEKEEFDGEELPEACQRALNRIECYSTKPGHKVFIENGNCDGWISTDSAVEVTE